MKDSKIEWCDHTFSAWEGCTKVSPGCANCYAETRNNRYHGGENWGPGAPRKIRSDAYWKEPLKWNAEAANQKLVSESFGKSHERPRVFCSSLADWLDEEGPLNQLSRLLELIHKTPNLDWLLLTKRPQAFQQRVLMAGMEMMGYVDGQRSNEPEAFSTVTEDIIESVLGWSKLDTRPPNVWIGTTVEDQQRAEERIPHLLNIPAKIRFISCEPLLGPVDLSAIKLGEICSCCDEEITGNAFAAAAHCSCCVEGDEAICWGGLHWVICGGESGPKARPMREQWATSLRDQCKAAGVAFFMKQMGGTKSKRGDLTDIPSGLHHREFPAIK